MIACCQSFEPQRLASHLPLHVRQALVEEVDRALRLGLVERAVASVPERIVAGDELDDLVQGRRRRRHRKNLPLPSMMFGVFGSGSGTGADGFGSDTLRPGV